jgi:integrase
VVEARAAIGSVLAKARLSDIANERVQTALATLRGSAWSAQTCNHYRASVRAFARWTWKTGRLRENPLASLTGYNAKEDPRHERRTLSLDELTRLIEGAEQGPTYQEMTGPMRALCYRLAVASGLRYSEIGSVVSESFEWDAPSVTVTAAHTKNGDPATQPLPRDLADDLAVYVATLPGGTPIFPLPEKGASMLRLDLKAAGIAYETASGFFDFHSLRCQMATLADAAGVSPRVVQRLMRHSTLELTGRYTRPRVVDIEAAASMLPSLRPTGNRPEAPAMTGTDDAAPTNSSSAWVARRVQNEAFSVGTCQNEVCEVASGELAQVPTIDGSSAPSSLKVRVAFRAHAYYSRQFSIVEPEDLDWTEH